MKYSVKAAARATGVTESRLRTWERRYGIPSPQRSASGRRQYDESDLAVIRRMAQVVSAGVPASEAAEVARLEGPNEPPAEPPPPAETDPRVTDFVEATSSYDEQRLLRSIDDARSHDGWLTAVEGVIFPALRLVGEQWARDNIVSANEHFATELVILELSSEILRLRAQTQPGPPILLACPEDEQHTLGLLALCLLLKERGRRVVYLGADVPERDLTRAAADLRPAAVCLSATLPTSLTALRRSLRALIQAPSGARLYVGGPALVAASAADTRDLPAVILPGTLGEAVGVLGGAV